MTATSDNLEEVIKVPGTTQLVDFEDEKTEIVLIPTPSEDPNDPLNWTRGRKLLQVFCLVLYVFATGVPGTCIYSIIPDIAAAKGVHITVGQLNAGTGFAFLFLGIGCFVFQPLAMQYGKRPVYLFSTLSCAFFNLWQPFIVENKVWIASKILAGVVTSPIEALPESTISDMFFEHERATYMGIYACALYGSNYLAPLVAGFINENSANTPVGGWRWVIFWATIFCSLSFVFLFFFMEETNYERVLEPTADGKDLVVLASRTSISKEKNTVTIDAQSAEDSGSDHIDARYGPAKTFYQKLSLTSGVKSKFLLWEFFKTPFYMFRFPVVLWSGFLYGSSLFWYMVLNGTEALVLMAPPYNFSSSMCGLAYLSPVIFVIIIYFYAGWATDWLKIKMAKRRNGLSHAEDRLYALSVYAILGPCSLILWGVGALYQIHWFGVVFGLGLMAGLCIIGSVNAVLYVIDTYHEVSCEAMATVIFIRNTIAFAGAYGIVPWLDASGMKNTFIAAAFICLVCIGSFALMIPTGYFWRNKTKGAYWNLLNHRASVGISH